MPQSRGRPSSKRPGKGSGGAGRNSRAGASPDRPNAKPPPPDSRRGAAAAGKARAAREAARQRAERTQRLKIIGIAVAAVAVVVAVLVIVKVTTGNKGTPKHVATGSTLSKVVNLTTTIPSATLDGVPASGDKPKPLRGAQPLTTDGKPALLYAGAEFCPYCAAQRWPLVIALSRFGTFTGLQTTSSSSTDALPDTATFTFLHAKYSSRYLAFQSVELSDHNGKKLQSPTKQQGELLSTYDLQKYTGGENGSIPFLYYDGKFVSSGATYDGNVLQGKSQLQIATAIQKPDGKISKAVLGAANTLTAQLCTLTKGQPARVCTSAAATSGAGKQ